MPLQRLGGVGHPACLGRRGVGQGEGQAAAGHDQGGHGRAGAAQGAVGEGRAVAEQVGPERRGPQGDQGREQALRRQERQEIEAGRGQNEGHGLFQAVHPGAGARQQTHQARPDGQHAVGRGHAQANGAKDRRHHEQGLQQRPGQHAAEERAAAGRGQKRGEHARQKRAAPRVPPAPRGNLEVHHRQVEDAEEA